MIPGTNSCFPNVSQGMHMYLMTEDVVPSTLDQAGSSSDTQPIPLPHNLSLLKEKVHQLQSLVSTIMAQDQVLPESTSIGAIANIGTVIQEIVVTASSVMFAFQQVAASCINYSGTNIGSNHELQPLRDRRQESALSVPNFGGNGVADIGQERRNSFISDETLDHWYGDHYNSLNNSDDRALHASNKISAVQRRELTQGGQRKSPESYDIVELDAADLLAKYTHYCKVCGKGFKRDANLRMHMRAHGDEYKTIAALSNPMKNNTSMGDKDSTALPTKYSCPQGGCRWNQKHAKFQPLKSMICVKNHYKRSHCPKMYACKRCNKKQFSVLSDLKTHEKHCGHLKWQCSCGTIFSRKDKLMGHVGLFVGHTPAIISFTKPAKPGSQLPEQMQPGDRQV